MIDRSPDDPITSLSARSDFIAEHTYGPPQTLEEADASPSPMRGLSKDALERFFAAKWRNGRCEVCDATGSWRVPAEDIRLSVSSAITKEEPVNLNSTVCFVALVIYCENCGNMKLLNAETIVDWLEKEKT